MKPRTLDAFLKPESVAIIGLSRAAIGAPVSVLTSLDELGYRGRVYVVNPGLERTATLHACPTIAAIPEVVDLAIVSVERARVHGVLEECVRAGIRAAIVITQGFADADAEGRRLQDSIAELAKRTGLRILGPNTIGVVNSHARFTSSFIEVREDSTPIGQVSQSGLFMMGHHLINNEPAGYCMSVDLGNGCDIGLVDVLEYFEHEDAVRVIQCHAEGIVDGAGFLDAATRIGRAKPVVALKAGTTDAGRAAVASHTGSVAGAKEVYGAAFRKAGIVPAGNAEDLRLLSKAFAVYRPPKGRRVAIMSFSGGGAILAIDALDREGLELATLSEATKKTLGDLFPGWTDVHNPLDIWMPVAKDFERTFPRVLETLLADAQVDAVLCIYCSYRLPKYALYDSSRHIGPIAARHPDKPVLGWTYGLDIEGFTRKVEAAGPAMVFQSLDDAARTLARLADWNEHRSRPADAPPPAPPAAASAAADRLLTAAVARGQRYLFTEALDILAAYGLRAPPWRLARDEAGLADAARALAFPLCLKVVSADVVHKSDAGGVRLGLRDPDELARAWREMVRDVTARSPGARIEGAVVQEMAARGKEVLIGMKRDPSFGPCIVFGAGGTYAEALDDFAFRIAPLSEREAREMIAGTRVAKILAGIRGEPPCDTRALVDALVRVSQIACAHPAIAEIDLNPLFVDERGATVVDARFILDVPANSAG